MLVLFDSCWDPLPKLGPQRAPMQGVHNSGWVQSPGAKALEDASQYPRLKSYVVGVVGAFANDPRILAWDVWNEPGGFQYGYYEQQEPKNKIELVKALLPQAFAWARSANPSQPLTSGLWEGDWPKSGPTPMEVIQLQNSDIITFHNYSWPENFERRVVWLEKQHRPIICTEYMARSAGSTFDGVLPIAKKHHVGAINWGLVAGKTQTNFPWESWQHPYVLEPAAGVVSRRVQARWHAVPGARGGADPAVDGQGRSSPGQLNLQAIAVLLQSCSHYGGGTR